MSARSNLGLAVAAMMATVAMVAGARADGDPGRGGQLYRTCVACHSLEAGSHLTGPAAGAPVIVGAGMMGDRVSIVFANLRDLNNLVEESC